jgi:hypothetical protein
VEEVEVGEIQEGEEKEILRRKLPTTTITTYTQSLLFIL